ncbi:MAG: helix-turn-helix transcriptional regulator [Vulcanimicrobiaceae bacterium]
MHDARFLQTTRGKIVAALRRRRSASATILAGEFGLSTNAVRQQLIALERDGYVVERSVRRGPTKPTLEYSLSESAETLFPQRYDRLLNAVLREVKTLGPEAVTTVMRSLGERTGRRFEERLVSEDPKKRVYELAALLREEGVEAEAVEHPDGSLELREAHCPYAHTVGEHPEVCTIIHTVLHETLGPQAHQVESLATGGEACRFEVVSAAAEKG